MRNTLFICLTCIIGTVFSAALPAYGFARLQWKGRELLFIAMIATIMLPGQVTQMPIFLMFRSLHWTGTFLPLIVPSFFGSAFSIFMLRQFFLGIPQELSDAARIDGCSEFGIFWKIMLPLAKPPLAAIALFTFMGCWTDFQGPLIYLQNEKYFTLAIGLSSFYRPPHRRMEPAHGRLGGGDHPCGSSLLPDPENFRQGRRLDRNQIIREEPIQPFKPPSLEGKKYKMALCARRVSTRP